MGQLSQFTDRQLRLEGVLGKASIGDDPLFGGIGGKAVTTPTFKLGEGGLSRTDTEFLDASRRTLGDLRASRARFGEGFSEFRQARLQEVENARARTTGNLRSQLGRRGILGASFAQDAITRTELDFQNQADKVAAEVDVAEFEFNLKNLAQESQIAQANLSRELQELGLSLDFVSGINNAIVQRDDIAARLEIARLQRRGGGVRIGGTQRNLTRFTIGGSSSGGFTGSTGTTATSVPSTTRFADNFDIASTINPNTKSTGSFSSAFQA